jgi:NAD(P)-dependent dehydrogenase (short-subunit alcohol dehydrogenase family)
MPKLALVDILRLDGKTAIVTGGAKGIGRGVAERLIEAGAAVVISDIDEEAGKKTASEIGADFAPADMAIEHELERLLARTVARLGAVDILVNNVGIYPFSAALDMTAET